MVSGVNSPVVQNALVEALSSSTAINQARQGTLLTSSQLTVGKQFQGEVLATLADGSSIVRVADIAARMQLPNAPQPGSKLSLTLLSMTPRATFLLNPSDPAQPETATTTTAILGTPKQLIDDFSQNGNLKNSPASTGLYLQTGSQVTAISSEHIDAPLLTQQAALPDSTPTSFSSAGKLVNDLMQQTALPARINPVPLITTPEVNVSVLAKTLQTNLSGSGVFYESHLLQWAEGNLPTAAIMKEPQASFPAAAPNTAASPLIAAMPAAAMTPATTAAAAATVTITPTGSTPITANQSGTAAHGSMVLPKDALPIIQQQLQTMEQQRFVWHGELWAGQPLEWEVSRDQAQAQQNSSEGSWNSSVSFNLPQLGAVSAQLQLNGNRLHIRIRTKDATTALQLQQHTPELASALNGTGAQLDSIQITPATMNK